MLRVELKDREKFDSGDAETQKMGNFFDYASKGAAGFQVYAGARMASETGDVHFVNDRLGKGAVERRVPFPVVASRLGDDALEGVGGIVAGRSSSGAAVVAVGDTLSVGIEQDLLAVVTVSITKIERTVHAKSIELSWSEIGNENVPIVRGPIAVGIQDDDSRGMRVHGAVEQKEFYGESTFRENAEIDAAVEGSGAQGKTLAWKIAGGHGSREPRGGTEYRQGHCDWLGRNRYVFES